MTKASDNAFPSILITEGTEPSAPAAGKQRLYIDSTTHLLKATNSSGTDRTIEGVAAGAITSSGLTQATARLLGRTTASTGAIEEITVGSGLSLAAGSLTATGGGGGSMVWLQRQTASASATLDFTSFISSTYDKYVFEIVNLMPATTNTNLLLRMGTGGGPTYDSGTNYGWAGFRNSPTGSTHAGNSASQTSIVLDASGGIKSDVALPFDGTFRLYNPSSTAATKRFLGTCGYVDNAGAIINASVDGIYVVTTAVTAIRFLMSSGNITSGDIDCYGLTKA